MLLFHMKSEKENKGSLEHISKDIVPLELDIYELFPLNKNHALHLVI